jgi:ABC-type cobalamin/Fe3+-siderophores transport system ATPase subunit
VNATNHEHAPSRSRLGGTDLRLAYDERVIVDGLSVDVPDGAITAIVGANACGKSTLLRALARLLKPQRGRVLLDGREIHSITTKAVARRLGLLPQSPIAPEGITVGDLVARGRSPHQKLLQQWSHADEAAVVNALTVTDTIDLADRAVDELSGGQRQRVWIAMALAQETPILLLDEPTTFLDIAHQIEVLDLVADLNDRRGATVVMVLHDLNHACRYADHVIAMSGGAIVASGAPAEVITAEVVREVFGLECIVVDDPVAGTPMVVPAARSRRPSAALVAVAGL